MRVSLTLCAQKFRMTERGVEQLVHEQIQKAGTTVYYKAVELLCIAKTDTENLRQYTSQFKEILKKIKGKEDHQKLIGCAKSIGMEIK